MKKTITVKGQGYTSVNPDLVEVSIGFNTHEQAYEVTMQKASVLNDLLSKSLVEIGFERSDIKTKRFNVRTNYKSVRDENNNYTSEFDGYVCDHSLKLAFPFTTERLNDVLNAITASEVKPKIDINFTVSNKNKVDELLLQSATDNALTKAKILAKASNVTLGDLLSVDYNWVDITYNSPTTYDRMSEAKLMVQSAPMDIVPEDIELSEYVTFVWEVK